MSEQILYFWQADERRWQGIRPYPDLKAMQVHLVKHGYIVRRGAEGSEPAAKPTPDELKQLARQLQP